MEDPREWVFFNVSPVLKYRNFFLKLHEKTKNTIPDTIIGALVLGIVSISDKLAFNGFWYHY